MGLHTERNDGGQYRLRLATVVGVRVYSVCLALDVECGLRGLRVDLVIGGKRRTYYGVSMTARCC